MCDRGPFVCVYLSAPAARPPAARYSGTLRYQSHRAAGDRGLRQTEHGIVPVHPHWSRSISAGSPGPPCTDESRPHQNCQSCHTADTGGDPLGLKTGALQEKRAGAQTRNFQSQDLKQKKVLMSVKALLQPFICNI